MKVVDMIKRLLHLNGDWRQSQQIMESRTRAAAYSRVRVRAAERRNLKERNRLETFLLEAQNRSGGSS